MPNMSSRGQHPDLNPDGTSRPDGHLPPSERDFVRRFADPGENAHFMGRVAAWQSRQPEEVQAAVQGQTFGAGKSAYDGFVEYVEAVGANNQYVAGMHGKDVFVSDDDIDGMSLEQYDQHFDENARPRPHVYYHPSRALRVDNAMDPWTAFELHQRSRPRNEQQP